MADRLYFRGLGYKHKAVKIFHHPDTGPVKVPYVEHYPPDTNAALAWLSRRQPELWRERKEVDITGTLQHQVAQMTPEQRADDTLALAARIRRLAELTATDIEPEDDEEPQE